MTLAAFSKNAMISGMKILLIFISLIFSNAGLACWNLKGAFKADSYVVEVNQKFIHGKVYSYSMGPYILHIRIPKLEEVQITLDKQVEHIDQQIFNLKNVKKIRFNKKITPSGPILSYNMSVEDI